MTICSYPACPDGTVEAWLQDDAGNRVRDLDADELKDARAMMSADPHVTAEAVVAALNAQAAQAVAQQAAPVPRARWVPPETMRALPINSDLAARLYSGMARGWEREELRRIAAHPEITD